MRTATPITSLTSGQCAAAAINLPLAQKVAWKWRATAAAVGLDVDDVEAASVDGLMGAARLYNPALGYAFSTYCWTACSRCIQREVANARRRRERYKNADEALDLQPDVDAVAPDAGDSTAELVQALGKLDRRDRRVLTLRFGLDGGGERTLGEIGAVLKLSRQRIQQLEERALIRLHRACERLGLRWSEVGA